MTIYGNQLVSLINSCNQTARMRGFSDVLFLPLEWRPAGGISLLQQYASGDAILDKSVNSQTMQKFINAYGGYMDENLTVKHTMVAQKAMQRMGR